MVKVKLSEKVTCQNISLFDPSRNQINYVLKSDSESTVVNFTCVEKHSDVVLGQEFSNLLIYDSVPIGELPSIISMEVRFSSVAVDNDKNSYFYSFQGFKKPYSEVSIYSDDELIDSKEIGNTYFIGIE